MGGFDEHDHEVGYLFAGAGLHGADVGKMLLRAIFLQHGDTILVDALHLRLIHIQHGHIVVLTQVSTVQASHSTGTNHNNLHTAFLPI